MKLLADTCVSRDAVVEWALAGHDVLWAGGLDRDPGDEELLKRARAELRVVLTLDKDFGALAVLWKLPHCGIIRLVGFRAAEQGSAGLARLSRSTERSSRTAPW